MRAQNFLQTILDGYNINQSINLPRAATLAQSQSIRGGWEVWLQLEIAHCFLQSVGNWLCERERAYPATQANTYLTPAGGLTNTLNSAAKCDFYLRRTQGISDDTHVELKCISQTSANPIADAWNRFGQDVLKQQTLKGANATLNGISVLATFGTFQQADVAGPNPALGWCWAGNRSAYALDPANNRVSTLQNVMQGGGARLFLVAVSV